MKVLLQRVREACVEVDGNVVGKIERGLLLLIGIEAHDDEPLVERMAQRIVGYRVFADEAGKMNLDVRDAGGALLAVSQFTLAADTRKGRRPSFSCAAEPEQGRRLYEYCVRCLRDEGVDVATGIFAADMQVHLINDGPVTFLLEL
ncbi:D-tyrosyl-tRNA(Tyr) deacylase [Alcanivorax nanhaiticus]|uniref:D-aminoacyl-tRNA deacylase n=1 Tax=Alcanivorax nanhaiticus TaxID=1177154 RepID=A0A095SI69_9GAMM|nr:D-aminoacyl-tRNA deacylase [Alcanivorax nanhaiticus]KGD64351.1 D-tyrosyl-tRNA(Tyr) deacylase [Alcanivorax nanhaiticus]